MATTVRTAAPVSADRTALALAVLRVIVGAVFIAHGAQKLFVYGIAGTTGAFGGMGIPMAGVVAPLTAGIEFLGGIALVLGFGTRIAAALLAATMLGAITMVHLKGGFFLPSGVEYALTLFGAAAAIAIAGPGAASLDGRLFGRRA